MKISINAQKEKERLEKVKRDQKIKEGEFVPSANEKVESEAEKLQLQLDALEQDHTLENERKQLLQEGFEVESARLPCVH